MDIRDRSQELVAIQEKIGQMMEVAGLEITTEQLETLLDVLKPMEEFNSSPMTVAGMVGLNNPFNAVDNAKLVLATNKAGVAPGPGQVQVVGTHIIRMGADMSEPGDGVLIHMGAKLNEAGTAYQTKLTMLSEDLQRLPADDSAKERRDILVKQLAKYALEFSNNLANGILQRNATGWT